MQAVTTAIELTQLYDLDTTQAQILMPLPHNSCQLRPD